MLWLHKSLIDWRIPASSATKGDTLEGEVRDVAVTSEMRWGDFEACLSPNLPKSPASSSYITPLPGTHPSEAAGRTAALLRRRPCTSHLRSGRCRRRARRCPACFPLADGPTCRCGATSMQTSRRTPLLQPEVGDRGKVIKRVPPDQQHEALYAHRHLV